MNSPDPHFEAKLKTVTSTAELDGFAWGLRTYRTPTTDETSAVNVRRAELQRNGR